MRRLGLVLAATAAIGASGCGSGGAPGGTLASTTTTTTHPSTVASVPKALTGTATGASAGGGLAAIEFKVGAEAICRHLSRSLVQAPGKHITVAEIVHTAPKNAALERETAQGLASLSPPPAQAARWRRVVVLWRALAEELKALGAAAKTGDTTALNRLAASKKRTHASLQAAAKAAEVPVCGRTG